MVTRGKTVTKCSCQEGADPTHQLCAPSCGLWILRGSFWGGRLLVLTFGSLYLLVRHLQPFSGIRTVVLLCC